jgi:hypothetical protein
MPDSEFKLFESPRELEVRLNTYFGRMFAEYPASNAREIIRLTPQGHTPPDSPRELELKINRMLEALDVLSGEGTLPRVTLDPRDSLAAGGVTRGNVRVLRELADVISGDGPPPDPDPDPEPDADPIITSLNPSGTYAAGAALGGTLTANEPVTWSVIGPNADLVTSLNPTTGVWSGQVPEEEPAPITLAALGGTFSLAEDAAANAVAGALTGKTADSTLSLTDDAGGRVALSGTNVVRGATALNYEDFTSHSFTVRETLAGATNSPRDTVRTLNVTDVSEGGGSVLPYTDDFESNPATPLVSRPPLEYIGPAGYARVENGALYNNAWQDGVDAAALVLDTGMTAGYAMEWIVDNNLDNGLWYAVIRFVDMDNFVSLRLPYQYAAGLQLNYNNAGAGITYAANLGAPARGLHTWRIELTEVGANFRVAVFMDGVRQLVDDWMQYAELPISGYSQGTRAGLLVGTGSTVLQLARSITFEEL